MSVRFGKIARLPALIREDLNERIANGASGHELLTWLNSLPETKAVLVAQFASKPINKVNLSAWRQGGFKDWMATNERLERGRQLAEWCTQLAKENSKLTDGVSAALSIELLDALSAAIDSRQARDSQSLQKAADALNRFSLSVASLRAGDHRAEQLRIDRERLAQAENALQLTREKMKRQTCELFLRWAENSQATEIASSNLPDAEKIEQLRRLMFATETASG